MSRFRGSKAGQLLSALIADLAVTTAKIADLAVTAAKLAADSVITSKILDGNVTLVKIAAAVKSAAQDVESLRQIYSSTPAGLGTAAAGNSVQAAAGNHVHSSAFATPSRTDATTTPTVTSADANGSVRCTSASNINVTFDATTKVTGHRTRLIKGNAGTNTFSITPPTGVAVVFLGVTGSTGTITALGDGASALQPSWDVEYDGTNLIVS